jgi:ethanolamine utilization protein EutP
MVNREVIGIVTKIDQPKADIELAALWLRNAGCETIFYVNSKTGEGVDRLLEYLREPGDILPWEKEP